MIIKKFYCSILFLIFSFSAYTQINTDKMMANGKVAIHFEDYVLAIQYFNQVIKVKPFLAEPYFYRGVAKLELNDFRGSEDDCSLCIERNPFIIKAYECRGIARQQIEDYNGAIEDYKRVLEYYPNEKSVMQNMAVAYAQKKDYEQAEKELTAIIERFPDSENAYLTRGRVYAEKGDTLKAIEDLNKAIELDKYSSYAYATRAMIAYMQEKYQNAVDDYTEAIKLEPQQGYYVNRGLANYQLSNLQEAMNDYDKAVELDPEDLNSRYNRGILRAQVADNNRAIEDFDKVLEIDRSNYFAYYNRAMLRTQTGDYKGAIADYTVVLNEYPDFTPGYQNRSYAKRLMGDAAGADRDIMAAWRIEERLRKDRKAGKIDLEDDNNDLAAKEEQESADEKTRKQSDKNIRNFNKVVVADNTSGTTTMKYDSDLRGKVQNKNVTLELLPVFVASYYEKIDALKTRSYYNQILFDYNKQSINNKILRITNTEASLTEDEINLHFESILAYSNQIEKKRNDSLLYFARGLDHLLVQDFSAAIDDFTRAINLNEYFVLAYFDRAVARSKHLEYESYSEQSDSGESKTTGSSSPIVRPKSINEKEDVPIQIKNNKTLGWDFILSDYEKIISIAPDFFYAYYNRASIRFSQKDYKAAVEDYTKAIALEPELSEAYFNRGITYIYMGENEQAISDLSKAGELGIVSSYSIIKRLREIK